MAQSCSTEELAAKITAALDPTTVRTVQATAKRRFLLEFSSVSAASSMMTVCIDIEGVHLTPMVAFDKLTSVFVLRITPRVTDDQFVKAFSPFGRVVSVKPLPLRLQPCVFSGTRLIWMAVSKPIPSFFQVMGFPGLVRYRGQPFQCFWCRELGHCYRECPSKPIPSARRHRKAHPSSSPSLSPSSCPGSPPPLVIVECRPNGVVASPIVSSSSAPVAEGELPRPAGAPPSAPVLNDVGCQTTMESCLSMTTQTSVVLPPKWIAVAESQTPPPPVCHDVGTYLQHELACCVRYNIDNSGAGKRTVCVCREDLLEALLIARVTGTRSGCSVVGWQLVQRVGSQAWPVRQFGLLSAHQFNDVQLAFF